MNTLTGFACGIAVSLFGAFVANHLTRRREMKAKLNQHRFQIYMKLMDVYADYFWFSSAEVRNQKLQSEIRERCRSRSWEIVDMLRAADDMEYLNEILDVLMGHEFTTALDRYEAIGALLNKLGKLVNPKYQQKMSEISKGNIKLLSSGSKSNAPGSIYQ